MSDEADKPGGRASIPRSAASGALRYEGKERPSPRELSRRLGQLVVGRLMEHGRANYQFRADQDPSYYLKVLSSRGAKTLWGKDLERALSASETQAKIGDLIGARRVSHEAVTITARERDSDGRVVSQEAQLAHRTRWVVEKVKFFADRARLARQLRDEQIDVRESVRAHPELKSSFLSVRAAEEFAEQRIADPKDRVRFLDLVRGALVGSVQKGEPLPSVQLRNRVTAAEPRISTPRPPRRDEPTR